MRRKMIVFGLALLFAASVSAQKNLVQGSGTGTLYLNHTVAAKEGLYSIGRMYNIAPKDLAAFNGMQATQGLSIGQTIKIPLASNFSQDINAASKPGAVPVYYTVKEKEGMYRVSLNHNKVTYDALKKWNGLPGETLTVGQPLIIGYITGAGDGMAAANNNAPVKTEPVTTNPVKEEVVVKTEEKKETAPPVVKEESKPVVKEETKPVVKTQPVYTPKGSSYFQRAYEDEIRSGRTVKTTTLSGAIFKSTSGWQDGKFYILMNSAQPGTLVKITNIGSNKTIYAKVLGEVPDLRQNSGLSFRLSNAAAAELGVKEDSKFNVEISQ
ncbi:LysM peptidoglycan-binding domain-containing protein [Parasegetibacter sp. NRK P23]|uniref:muramidase family protein n=1 Tax=Parasegetibacter sp. NRK P23 TaxID=2942999 RepID=UPI00204351DF|nr:LysM peptidoglycan-binding domain-containing protein [Parasegetibacter sp. NRK P23]MCM5528916.1 LysM peptidoglycan-binding domain-containing protein [Parasegetibacter sp. NRK P23]